MESPSYESINLTKLNIKLKKGQKRHNMSEKLAVAHRKTFLEWVLQSMAFENEPIDMARLKKLF
ncbi:MAG: hypothetical protein ACE5FZ_00565 [Nitrospiria bacterium]